MGDDDELRLFGKFFEEAGEFVDVRLVQRRLDLVQHAEGHGAQHEDGEEDGDGGERPLAAREQRDLGQLLAGRAGDDLDARREGVVALGVVHLQLRAPAAEQLAEELLEVLVDAVEALVELLLHLRLQLFERGARVVDAPLHVVALGAHLLVLRAQRLVFLDGVVIDGAQGGDLAAQAVDRRLARLRVEGLVLVREAALVRLVVFLRDARLQIVQFGIDLSALDLLLVPLLGELLGALAVGARGAQHPFQLLVERLLEAGLRLLTLAQIVQLLPLRGGEGGLLLLRLQLNDGGGEVFGVLLRLLDARAQLAALLFQPLDGVAVGGGGGAILRHIHMQRVQPQVALVQLPLEAVVFAAAAVGLALRVAAAAGDLFLPFRRGADLAFQLPQAGVQQPDRGLLLPVRALVFGDAGGEGLLLFEQGGAAALRFLEALAQRFQRGGGLLPPALRLRLFGGEARLLLFRGGDVRARLFDAALVGEEAAAPFAAGAARHRAARGDDVAVQRDDAEGVGIFFRDGGGRRDGLGDERVADEVVHDVGIVLVVAHQLGSEPDRARLAQRAAGVVRLVAGLQRVDGEEGDLPALRALEVLDQAAGVLRGGGDDVLHRAAERRLDGDLVLLVAVDDVRDDALDARGQGCVPARLAQQLLDRELIALEVLLDVAVEALALAQGGDAGVAAEQLFALFVRRGGKGSELAFPGGALLRLARDVFLHFRQPVGAGGEGLFVRFQLGGGLLRLRGELLEPLFRRFLARGEGADVLADLGEVLDRVDDAALRGVGERLRLGQLAAQLGDLGGERLDLPAALFDLLLLRLGGAERLFRLGRDLLQARGAAFGGLFVRLPLAVAEGDALADDLRVPLLLLQLDGDAQDLLVQLLQQLVALGEAAAVVGVLRFQPLRLGAAGVDLRLDGRHGARDALARGGGVVVLIDVQVDLRLFELRVQLAVAAGLFRLALERGEHVLDLAHALQVDVEVVVGIVEAALDLLAARLEEDDARRLLEDGAAVLRLGVHDLLDLALADDGVPLLPEAHGVQAVDDVLHAAGLLVDQILALAAAEEAAGHGDLGIVEVGEHLARIVEGERDLAKGLALARLRAAEDDVLHTRTAHGLGGLLAEHPADGVRHVALAAAVRPHDAGDAVVEADLRLVREGLESVEFYFFEVHSSPPAPARRRSSSFLAASFCAARRLPPLPTALSPPPAARTVKRGACVAPSRESVS